MRYTPDTGTDPQVRAAERAALAYANAKMRLDDEKRSGCASAGDIAFWRYEVERLYEKWEETIS